MGLEIGTRGMLYWLDMEYYEMTNLARVEKLLADINARRKNKNINRGLKNKITEFSSGKLGSDVAFKVKRVCETNSQNKTNPEYDYEEVELMAQGQPLAKMGLKKGFLNLGYKRKPIPTTIAWVTSPRYGEDGCVSKSIEAVKQLHVFHAPDETADSVIDEICDVVAYSKAKAAADKKFGTLNLATRLADASREM